MAEEDWRLFESDEKGLNQSPPDDTNADESDDAPDWGAPGLPVESDEEDVVVSAQDVEQFHAIRSRGEASASA